MDIKIVVATHKEYTMPHDDMYLPVFCGSKLLECNLPYQRDDEGNSISDKNKYYCELTGLYWAWKNLNAEYIGLNHYRRYFKYNNHLLTKKDAEEILNNYSVILPKKRHYYIETVYSQYIHAHGEDSLEKTREIISKHFPGYLHSFDLCMKKKSLHLFNIFIMRKDIFDDYCEFLFDVLFKVEQEIIINDRIFGYLAERLLDVYITTKHINYYETNILNKENENWPLKIARFLERKFSYV